MKFLEILNNLLLDFMLITFFYRLNLLISCKVNFNRKNKSKVIFAIKTF